MTQVNQDLEGTNRNEKAIMAVDTLKPTTMDLKEPPAIVVSYEDVKGDQENQYSAAGHGGNAHSNTTSTNNGGYKKHYHTNRYRGNGYHNAGNSHRHHNGYNNFNSHNGYHTNYHGSNNRPYVNKRQFHNNDYFTPQHHNQGHVYPHPSHSHSHQHGQHHGSHVYYGSSHYYPTPHNHYHSKSTSHGNGSQYLSSTGTTPNNSLSSPDVSQMSTSAGSRASLSLSEGSDSRGSTRPSSAEDTEELMAKTSLEESESSSSANSSAGSSLASKSPTPCFPTPESLDNMLPPCVSTIAPSGPRIPGGGSSRHGGWGDSPEPHYFNKGYYPFPPHGGPMFHPGPNLSDRHLPLPQYQPNPRFARRDGPYDMFHPNPNGPPPPFPYPSYFINGLGGPPCEPHPMVGPGGPGPMNAVFNPGPQFTFPDNLSHSNEPNKLMSLNEKTGVYEWTSCEDAVDIARIGSPSSVSAVPHGAPPNRVFPKRRQPGSTFTTHFDKASTIGQNHYPRKPFHFQGRPHWQGPNIRAEDYLNNYHFIADSDKPERLAPVGSEWENLTQQIWTKFQTNQQSKEMYKNKIELWKQLSDIVKACNPSYSLEVVGSTVSGFGSNTSDVDMCLLLNNRIDLSDRDEALEILENIGPKIKSIPNIENNELIHAKVPILKFKDAVHNLDVDINVNNAVGIRNTQLLFGYAQCDWRVRPLILVVKLWANLQEINDAKMMTLSSYSLSLMVIHYLQHAVSPPVLPCLQQSHPERYSSMVPVMRIRKNFTDPLVNLDVSQNTETLAELLLGFLEYFSVKFDYKTQAISVRNGSTVGIKHCMHNKAPKNDPYQWKHMCIEEPFEFTNTARSVYEKDSFDRVRGVFFASWQRLSKTRDLESIFKPISQAEAKMIGSKIRS